MKTVYFSLPWLQTTKLPYQMVIIACQSQVMPCHTCKLRLSAKKKKCDLVWGNLQVIQIFSAFTFTPNRMQFYLPCEISFVSWWCIHNIASFFLILIIHLYHLPLSCFHKRMQDMYGPLLRNLLIFFYTSSLHTGNAI